MHDDACDSRHVRLQGMLFRKRGCKKAAQASVRRMFSARKIQEDENGQQLAFV